MVNIFLYILDFAKKLLSCARKGNSELMSIYKASFENDSYAHETFDKSFFLDNAKDIVESLEVIENK